MSIATLYERLGGEECIRALATTIFDKHQKNMTIQTRYADSDRDDVIRLVTECLSAPAQADHRHTQAETC
jgi:hemoglobin